MRGEVVLLAVLYYQHPIGLKQRQGNGGYCLYAIHGVWRVGKDEAELLLAGLEKLEYVAPDESVRLALGGYVQLLHTLTNEEGVVAILLYAHDLAASP